MASTYSSLKFQLMATGENSGTWGNITNVNLGTAIEEAIVGSADVSFSSADVTLTLTDTNTTQAARNLRLNLIGTSGADRNLIVPNIEKVYIINNGLAHTATVKNATGTGVAVPAGKTMYVYNNGTNVVDAITHLTSLTTGTLTSTSTTVLNGTTIPASKTLVDTDSTQTLTNKTLSTGTAITAGTINGATIGATTASTGAFTTVAASSTVTTPLITRAGTVALEATGNNSITAATNGVSRLQLLGDGRVRFGATDGGFAGWRYDFNTPISGDVDTTNVFVRGAVQSSVTTRAIGVRSAIATQAATFTLSDLTLYYASQGSIGAGSTVTTQFGFRADSTLTGATNNFGFRSDIATATGRWNFYAAGTAANYFAGNTLVGSTTAIGEASGTETGATFYGSAGILGLSASGDRALFIKRLATDGRIVNFVRQNTDVGHISVTTSATSYNTSSASGITGVDANTVAIRTNSTERIRINSDGKMGIARVPTDAAQLVVGGTNVFGSFTETVLAVQTFGAGVNSRADSFISFPSVNNSSGTLDQLNHFYASQNTLTTTVSNQAGYRVESNLTGATNNFGVRSDIASGTGRFNFYAAGSADNFFAGNVGIGSTAPVSRLEALVVGAPSVITAHSSSFAATGNGTGFGVYRSFSSRLSGYSWKIDSAVQSGGSSGTDHQTDSISFKLRRLETDTTLTEAMRIDPAGRVGTGGEAAAAGINFRIRRTIAASESTTGFSIQVQNQYSGAMSTAYSVWSQIRLDPNATLTDGNGYFYAGNNLGAGASITNQYAFHAGNGAVGATNNYGFLSNIAAGTGRFNFYAAGSAPNYFAGTTLVGKTVNDNTTTGVVLDNTGVVSIVRSGNLPLLLNRLTSDGVILDFRKDSTTIGSISVVSSSIQLNTNAVARLSIKQNGQTRFIPLASAPAGAENGDVYYNSTTNKLQVYAAGAWVDLH